MHRNGLDSTKKSYKNDILLILFFLIIGIGAFAFMQLQGKSGAEVKVSVNNKEYGIYSLDKNQTVTIGEDDWENILIIKDGKASMLRLRMTAGAVSREKVCFIAKRLNVVHL